MTTMQRGAVECAVILFNDDNGHGITLCGESITPFDLGPRFQKVTCPKCLELAAAERMGASKEGAGK